MKLRDIVGTWTPSQWDAMVLKYVDERYLSGRPCPCPICGGTDRFTYDNKHGRGDWVCRKCNNGAPKAGDGLELIRLVTGKSFHELACEIEGGRVPEPRLACERPNRAGTASKTCDAKWKARRLASIRAAAVPVVRGDHGMAYLAGRVPGLDVAPSPALHLAQLDFWHGKQALGRYPAILAEFTLPDGRLATLHRTFLDRDRPCKATIVCPEGEILPCKRNEVSALPLAGGAVRLMQPVGGVIGVAEGMETAYAAHMLFGVPTWSCLNRVLLKAFFEVPEGLGIHTVHIFADFDKVDPKTGKSPGMADALALEKRLRASGFKVVLHRPKVRGTDFCDEWLTVCRLRGITQALPVTA
jgi:putative DNA primase/helicase